MRKGIWGVTVGTSISEEKIREVVSETGGNAEDEKVAAAVEKYLKKNPPKVTESDPTVPDWAKEETKPSYTAAEVGAVAADELNNAVTEALAQAKASGEFDGKDGRDGQDGKDGVDGYTPQKNVDYFDGKDGRDGVDGQDGITPHVGSNGNWLVGENDTGIPATGPAGGQGLPGAPGEDGKDGVSATHSWNGTVLTITSASGTSSADLKGAKGDQGEKGADGAKGDKGDQGIQGIQGEKGDKGDPGEKGEQGIQGEPGQKGDKGDKGDTGSQGIQGEKGDKGDKGDPYMLTDTDKATIVNAVIAALPVYNGEVL